MKNYDYIILKRSEQIDWKVFCDKTVYITGATGLIGSNIVDTFLTFTNANIVIQVRNVVKAKNKFGDMVKYVVCDLDNIPFYEEKIDYIIHCACPTSSKYFINCPVETIKLVINGTLNILEFAKEKKVKGIVLLSTMEVYGSPKLGKKIKEYEGGSFDSAIVRNCYPISKQTSENICAAYASEYNIHARVLRLTQTFGPGVDYFDDRVFAEFARCAIEKKDIILKTKGETERSYLYTMDAVTAILTVLLYGNDGEIYTAANEETYCSVFDMAKMIAKMKNIGVVVEEQDVSSFGYANTTHVNLDVSKLRGLGWKAYVGLQEMYSYLIEDMITKT